MSTKKNRAVDEVKNIADYARQKINTNATGKSRSEVETFAANSYKIVFCCQYLWQIPIEARHDGEKVNE